MSDASAAAPRRRVVLRVLQVVASFAVVGILFAQVLPRVTGTDGQQIWHRLSQLSVMQLAALLLVWLAGLWAYTWVLTGSLPGLTHAQALTLNLAGSAVSNLVSFGGAVGIGVTFAMAGSWGFRPVAITLSTLVSGLWNVLAKLALPLLGLVGLLVAGEIADRRLVVASIVAAAVLTVGVAATIAALSSERAARLVSMVVEWLGTHLLRIVRSRFDDIELNCLTFMTMVTDDRDDFAAKVAPVFGIPPAEVMDVPHAFIGTVDQICDDLEVRRDRWGFSYFVVQADGLDSMAPVVARMTGR